MNQDVKAKWLEALRSGKYQQGPSYLREGYRFCCLGVLCEIAVADGVIESTVSLDDGEYVYYYDGDSAGLSPKVQEWSGVQTSLGGRSGGDDLYDLNDRGVSFTEIAEIIEQEF